MDVPVNYLAVFLAMVSSIVVGSIWYSRKVFGNLWIKLAKVDMDANKGNVAKPIILTAIASLVTAYVLAHVSYLSNNHFGHSFLQDTLTTAFWLWLGFTAARILTHDLFEGRPFKLTLLTWGNELVTILLMALIIGLMPPEGLL